MEKASKKIIRTTNILAVILSVSVAVLLPLGYFVLSYQYQSAVLKTEAEAGAYFVTQLINANPDFWRYSQHRFEETLSHHLSKEYDESRRIVDLDNNLIASNSVTVQAPVMTRSHNLFDSGTVVARIEVSNSIKPLLNNTALFSALGLILGSVGFLSFKIFPLRALSDTLKLLYESEEKFRAITTTAVDGIIVINNKGCITYWNPAAERIFGYTHEEALGKELHIFIAPGKYHKMYKKGFDVFMETGQGPAIGKTIEFTAVKNDGTEFPIEVSTSTIRIKGEWHAVGLVHDITARKNAETEIYNSQQMLRLVLDNIPQRVFWKDTDCNYLGCNRASALDAGLQGPDEIIGKSDFDLLWKEKAESYRSDDKYVMETASSKMNYEENIRKPDGSIRWMNTNKMPLYDNTGKVIGVLGTYEDVTGRKEAERDLAELYEKVREKAEISSSLLQLVETLNGSLEEKELVRNVLNLAPKYLGFNRMILFYHDDAGGLTCLGSYGLTPVEETALDEVRLVPEEYPAVKMLLKGETVLAENGRVDELLTKELADTFNIKNAVIVPVLFRGKMSGAIYSDYMNIKSIEQRDLILLKALAHWMGIAYQNSKLYKESNNSLNELTDKIETIKAMAQLDREILSTIDRADILKSAAVLTSRLVPCDRVAVLLKNGTTYSAVTEWGVGRFSEKKYEISSSHFSIIETRQSSLSIPDISKDRVECEYHKDQRSIGLKSSFLVPLINKSELLGILDIGSLDFGKLTSSHLSTAEKIASQITVALENARLYEDLEHLLINTITTLAHTIDAKSPWTKGHSERVTGFAVEIAKEMGLDEKNVNHVKLCGILHDIGKIGTYDGVLDKPGKLTDEEYEHVKKHPEKGAEILAPIKQLREVVPGILYHHERYDGKGYPFGIKGNDIPLCAGILAVADSFDSMTADRPYRKSPGVDYAIEELKRCSGSQFDPEIVEVFLRVLKKMGKQAV